MDFHALTEEEREIMKGKIEFNGIKFGKGRYNAVGKDEPLYVSLGVS